MAKYNKTNAPLQAAKNFISISEGAQLGFERTLKTYSKMHQNNVLYEEGKKWFKSGQKIEEATQTVNFCGDIIQKKENRCFVQGFMAGIRERGYQVGYSKCLRDNLPSDCIQYADNDKFNEGYYEGIGFKFGYDGIMVDEIPLDLVQEKAFLQAYKVGIETKSKEINRKASKKR